MADVLLASMPFGNVLSPSIGLSLLKAGLTRAGVSCRVRYFSLPFAERVGTRFYLGIADDREPSVRELPGEWIFAGALFGADAAAEDAYVSGVLRNRSGWILEDAKPVRPALVARIRRARGMVEGFLDACLEEVERERPRILGFTSVFQQHVASLALAKRVKEKWPETLVVFGGANAEEVMGAETVRQFPFVDAVVSGEGDLVFPELVRLFLDGRGIDSLPGVITQARVAGHFARGQFPVAPAVADMDALPYPDYDDFVEQFRKSRFARSWQTRIFYESSRGCWWGEKHHCTFCGLNGGSMAYRSKSPRRAVDELLHLHERHPDSDVQVVDNILDPRYFKGVLPELARRQAGVELFYETKANLRKDQVRLLKAAGVGEIQPGIESLSDAVLALMRKGVSALQNVQLLKWCAELGVVPHWNVLWGFPGEPPEDYAGMARLVPLLTHLQPPGGTGGIRLDRFSPNFFDSERLGFTDVTPLPAYGHIYPLAPEAVRNLAYHFSFRYADGRDVAGYVPPLLDALREWTSRHAESGLFMATRGDALVIWDSRPGFEGGPTVLSGLERDLYLACDAVADARGLASLAPADAVAERLAPLVERGLMLRQDSKYLALAVPLGDYSPAPPALRRVFARVRELGAPTARGARLRLRPLDGIAGVRVADDVRRNGRPFPRRRSLRLRPEQFSLAAPHALLVEFAQRTH
jgi:ribosomal peptide maturation radical SAM protein 1